jgi:phospholipase D1/2
MKDPLNDAFYLDTWQAVAEKNTKVFRSVFRCMPDSEVKNWKEYKEYAAYGERFAEIQSNRPNAQQKPAGPTSPGAASVSVGSPTSPISPKAENPQTINEKLEATHSEPERPHSELLNQETLSPIDEKAALKVASDPQLVSSGQNGENGAAAEEEKPRSASVHVDYSEAVNLNASQSRRRRRRANTSGSKREFHASDEVMDSARAEDLLNKVQGHLILWPYDWYVYPSFFLSFCCLVEK